MSTNLEIGIAFLTLLLLALAGAAVALFRLNLTRSRVKALLERHSPESVQAIVVWAGLKAYDAVEQIADAYEGMTSEQKQALAAKYAQALIELVLYGKASKTAATALLESQIRAEKHPALAAAPLPRAKPIEAVR